MAGQRSGCVSDRDLAVAAKARVYSLVVSGSSVELREDSCWNEDLGVGLESAAQSSMYASGTGALRAARSGELIQRR